jgi:hypothetical protein
VFIEGKVLQHVRSIVEACLCEGDGAVLGVAVVDEGRQSAPSRV